MSKSSVCSGQWILKMTPWLFERDRCANLKRQSEVGEVREFLNRLKLKVFLFFTSRILKRESTMKAGSEKHHQYLNLINKLR